MKAVNDRLIHAAIYARKSNEQKGVNDEEKSVTRQIEHAKEYARKNGWTVSDAHVFTDDGISGVEFEHRPGLQTLLAALKPRPPFTVLVMMEPSRLGREQFETGYLLKRFHEAGVEIHYYLSGRKAALGRAIEKFMASVESYSSEQEREHISDRTKDGLKRKREQGYAVGPAPFGFKNIPVLVNGTRQHSTREVVPAEAKVIKRLFTMYADGMSTRKTAHRLNADNCPAPTPRQKARREAGIRAWTGTTVRSLLLRASYRAIVGNRLWERVQGGFTRPLENNPLRRPPGRGDGKYLLTGLATCGWCGGPLIAVKTGQKSWAYKCGTYHRSGPTACKNSLKLPHLLVERAVAESVEQDLLSLQEPMIKGMVKELLAHDTEDQGNVEKSHVRTNDLAKIEAELTRLKDAIKMGGPLETLVSEVQALEERKAQLQAQRSNLSRSQRRQAPRRVDRARAERDLRAAFEVVVKSLGPMVTRGMLQRLLTTRLVFTPGQNGKTVTFEGEGSLSPLVEGKVPSHLLNSAS